MGQRARRPCWLTKKQVKHVYSFMFNTSFIIQHLLFLKAEDLIVYSFAAGSLASKVTNPSGITNSYIKKGQERAAFTSKN